jgi:hypothetical protein
VEAVATAAALDPDGFPVDTRIQAIVDQVPDHCWESAIDTEGSIRDGAWVAEDLGMLDLTARPEGAKMILRAERPTRVRR